jgi:SAM-dependent methyltransferase
MDVKEQEILGDAVGQHWYYRAKAAVMQNLLAPRPPQHVLDVGAGSGFFSRLLLDQGAARATCVDPAYPQEHEEQQNGRPIRFVHNVNTFDADTVLLMDVLEHVDDDVGLLRYYADRAPAGARFLITVPAFQWMWSGHDIFLEHRRRYTLPQMENVIRQAGLKPVLGCYYYGLTLPIAAAVRLAGKLAGAPDDGLKSNMQRHSTPVNAFLGALSTLERHCFKFNRLGGLSVVCLAERAP